LRGLLALLETVLTRTAKQLAGCSARYMIIDGAWGGAPNACVQVSTLTAVVSVAPYISKGPQPLEYLRVPRFTKRFADETIEALKLPP
jgi:hypothetical protein